MEWSPLDFQGLLSTKELLEPASFLPGGTCLDCGSRHVSGLTILVRPPVDVFSPEVRHWDRVAIFAVMACASWHTYLLPTDYPEELRLWLFSAISNHGDTGYAKADVGDALSDRWARIISDAVFYPAAVAAFHEAAQSQLEFRLVWPLPNVKMYIPSSGDDDDEMPGHRLWTPTTQERSVPGVITRE